MPATVAIDRAALDRDGYAVVPGLVPEALCAAVRATVAAWLDVREDDPATWAGPGIHGHGIVPLHHPQPLWDVRQFAPIHAIFAELYGTPDLWVTIDRVSFKAPARLFAEPVRVDPVHWDGDPRLATPRSYQGLVYLADTAPEQGGFCCVPGLYRQLDAWLPGHAAEAASRRPDVSGFELVTVAAPRGSLVVWDRRLPHSSQPNHGERPRWVQYVAMNPAGDEAARAAHATLTREYRPPQWAIRQNVPRQQDPEPCGPPALAPLGRRLAGLEPWPVR